MTKRKRTPPRTGSAAVTTRRSPRSPTARKDYWLDPYDSSENRELSHRVLAQWESGGRRLPLTLDDKPADIAQVSIAEALAAYWKWAVKHYGSSDLECLRVVNRLLRQMLRAAGVDIGIISRQLWHRSIATTARYLDRIASQRVIETIRRRACAGPRSVSVPGPGR